MFTMARPARPTAEYRNAITAYIDNVCDNLTLEQVRSAIGVVFDFRGLRYGACDHVTDTFSDYADSPEEAIEDLVAKVHHKVTVVGGRRYELVMALDAAEAAAA